MEDRDIYLEALNDHYKETFSYQREYLKQRDSLFTYVLFVFAGMFILMTGADFAYSTLANVTNEKLGVIIEINSRVIDTILWFVLFSIVVKYYQISIVIERQYVYLKIIEAELNSIINKNYIFQREGNTYADYYKIFPTWVWIIYTFIFPTLLVVISGFKLYREIFSYASFGLTLMMDIILYGLILTSTVLYMISYHFKK